MTIEHEIDDGLTEEERAALVDEEGGTDNPTDTDTKDADAAAEAATAAAEADAAKATTEAAAAAAPADTDSDTTTEAPTQSAPILIAQPLEDATAKLAEIDSKKEALLTQFDDGDITAKDYQKQLDALAKEERAVEMAQFEAGIAAKLEQQRLQNDWNATCNSFVETHAIYKDNPRLYKALDAEVRELAAKPETAQWSGQKFLDEAHKNLKAAFGFTEDAKAGDTRPSNASSASCRPIWPRCPPPTSKTPTEDASPFSTAWPTPTPKATRKLSPRCRKPSVTPIWRPN